MPNHDNKHSIAAALQSFVGGRLTDHAISLYQTLGYNTARQASFSKPTYKEFYESYASGSDRFREDKALVDDWNYVDLLFQLSKDELSEQLGIFNIDRVDNTIIESYLFFVIGLSGFQYSRTALSQITREVNKLFPMPVMILFKHGKALTLAVINRRLHKKDVQKDVLEKVTLIKDIQIENPHRAHLEILADLSLENLVKQYAITNYVELHNAWQKTLDTKELNKRFYKDLSNWYFWAMQEVTYPDDMEKSQEIRNATNLIRLITRIIFIWFVKEKDLVPQELFQQSVLKKILKDFCNNNDSHSYYQAILQNLFFGILNQKMDERGFAQNQGYPKNKNQYGVKNLLRYDDLFLISEAEVLELFKDIPFLNGGLFDCLDTPDENGKIIYIDGFSRNTKKQAIVPDYLFFGEENEVDLNEIYGTKNKKYKTKGLIEILATYKFTVTENTPIEEEVALDPELLGKVFENLLASYNPETKTTARKQTGSFYTPREIVNYMVDESLIAHLTQKLDEEGYLYREEDLRELLSYTEDPNPFSQIETAVLIKAIDECKILDPACGSGAFPMGILHKLVHILHKIDPQNKLWKERQIEKAQTIDDPLIQEKLIRDIEEAFENNELDYGRKLYLIENCIYGVDIQPIAVQIAKLRFFIALIIDQHKQTDRANLGIQALPNLETKFVAANTLIPLEKPKGQLSFFTYKNPKIEKLEEKLKQLRHRYFNAKTRRDKLKYQNQDKATREQLSKLLIISGWSEHAAMQIAGFDPYSQNSSAPFFDTDWMFGIKEGFDIVIGNPPYFNTEAKGIYGSKQSYPKVSNGIVNIASLFIYDSLNVLLKLNGILSLIVPKSFLTVNSWGKIRLHILEQSIIIAVNDMGKAFEQVGLEQTVVVIKNTKNFTQDSKMVTILTNNNLNNLIPQSYFRENNIILTAVDKGKFEIIKKLDDHAIKLYSIADMPRGVTINAKDYNKERKHNMVQVLGGTNLERYVIKDGNKRKPNKYIAKYHEKILAKKLIFDVPERIVYQNIMSSLPKVVAAIEKDKRPTDDTLNNLIISNSNYRYEYILAIINSPIATFYLKYRLFNCATLTVHLDKPYIGAIPIKMANEHAQRIITNLVQQIINSKNKREKIYELEENVNEILFELYGLNEEEIDLITRTS